MQMALLIALRPDIACEDLIDVLKAQVTVFLALSVILACDLLEPSRTSVGC